MKVSENVDVHGKSSQKSVTVEFRVCLFGALKCFHIP